VPISVPRDRNGAFSPKLIGKYQTKTDDLENRIIAMYAKGMSNRDIEDHLKDILSILKFNYENLSKINN
jgi:putative transposase